MGGAAASCEATYGQHLREASWLDLRRDRENVTSSGPPIWRWDVPMRTPGTRVEAYLGPFDRERDSQDALVVMEYPDRIILAVADGVTPTDRTPAVDGVDGARYAASTVLEHVRAAPPSADLRRAFLTANAALLREFGAVARPELRARDRPQAAAIALAVEISPDGAVGHVDSARAADCEIWVRTGRGWELQSPCTMLKDGPRALLDKWDTDHPDASYQQRIREEMRILRDRSQWNLTALGRFERPKIDVPAVRGDFDELLVVTDGANLARLGERPSSGPRQWMPDLRASEAESRPPARPHTDVAMLHLRCGQASMR